MCLERGSCEQSGLQTQHVPCPSALLLPRSASSRPGCPAWPWPKDGFGRGLWGWRVPWIRGEALQPNWAISRVGTAVGGRCAAGSEQ